MVMPARVRAVVRLCVRWRWYATRAASSFGSCPSRNKGHKRDIEVAFFGSDTFDRGPEEGNLCANSLLKYVMLRPHHLQELPPGPRAPGVVAAVASGDKVRSTLPSALRFRGQVFPRNVGCCWLPGARKRHPVIAVKAAAAKLLEECQPLPCPLANLLHAHDPPQRSGQDRNENGSINVAWMVFDRILRRGDTSVAASTRHIDA